MKAENEIREEDVQIQKTGGTGTTPLKTGGYEEGIIRIVMAFEDSDHAMD